MRDILIIGFIVAAIILLLRVVLGTPLIRRVRESFASGSGSGSGQNLVNTMTECPLGAQMYMYEGKAFCCSGMINVDADTVENTCRSSIKRDNSNNIFCTLGPTVNTVANCLGLRSGLMQAKGETVCPPTLPNYVQGGKGSDTEAGRCCGGPANAAFTECANTALASCDVITDANLFKNPNSCQFIKAQHDDGSCPKHYGPFTAAGQGAMSDITLFGCTDNGQNCYSAATLKRLKDLGYDTKGLLSCSDLK